MNISSLGFLKGKQFYHVETLKEGIKVFHGIIKDLDIVLIPNEKQSNRFIFNIVIVSDTEEYGEIRCSLNHCWIDLDQEDLGLFEKSMFRSIQNK